MGSACLQAITSHEERTMKTSMSTYWSQTIRNLEPYVPGEQPRDRRYIKLNTNENPYPPSSRALEAIRRATNEALRLYPDPDCHELKNAIAHHYGVSIGQVFVGNSSDEVLALSFLAFFQQDMPILFPDVTYSFYEVYCNLFNIKSRRIPLADDFTIRPMDYVQDNGGIIFANPNALTGHCVETPRIRKLLEANTHSVVNVDEAYVDFGGETVIPLVKEFKNLLVVQTFSKSRSLAGLRVGLAIGHEELIEGLERAKNSFNSYPLGRLALAGAVAAIEDDDHLQETRRKVMGTRERVLVQLKGMGFEVVPSQANFLLMQHAAVSGKELYDSLRARGILVRYFNKPRVANHIRVTIGTDEEMDRFLESLHSVV